MLIQRAISLAAEAAAAGEVPVGAVIADASGNIVASAHNLVETASDPTAHAELLAIREACRIIGSPRLPEFDLYVTLEPCPMCAQAISFARIRRLYYGAFDPKGGGVDHGPRIFTQASCHHRPEVYSGIEESACSHLLRDFFAGLR